MLLHRFPVQLTPDTTPKRPQKAMSIMVSLYRKSVDDQYKQMICHQITEGKMDQYVAMMIICLVNQGNVSSKH